MLTQGFRADLQGLRAIAILLVVLTHANFPILPGGFIGVDVFFVLSGYLISSLLLREFQETGTIQLARFYARRLKRLLPSLLVVILSITLITPLLLSYHEVMQQTGSDIYAAIWSSNLYFAFREKIYFSAPETQDLFLHTWSLSVEEQFYLCWPLLLILFLPVLKKYLVKTQQHLSAALILMGMMSLLSFILLAYWTTTQPLWAFYLMPSRIWQFALGALVFIWLENKKTWLNTAWSGFIGLILIIGSALFLHQEMLYPGYWVLFPSIGAALIIASHPPSKYLSVNRLLSHPTLVWIGDRSYAWYLWHWPILILGFSLGMKNSISQTIALILISLLMSMLSYRLVELPFWKGRWSQLSNPLLSILLAILAMVFVITGILKYKQVFSVDENNQFVQIVAASRADIPAIYASGCDTWYQSAEVYPCMISGQEGASKTLVFIGDSIGAQWVSLLPKLFAAPEWRTIVLTKSSCPIVDEPIFYARIGEEYKICSEWRNAVLESLPSFHPTLVIIGSSIDYDFSQEQWIKGTQRILSRLTAVANNTIVLTGTPALSFNGPGCLMKWYTSLLEGTAETHEVCREALTVTKSAFVADALKQATQNIPTAGFLNLNDLVCPHQLCSALTEDGIIVFRDNQHLTNSFALSQYKAVAERLEKLGIDTSLQH